MAHSSTVVHLPDGQNLTVAPAFGGFMFKRELNVKSNAFPAGWTLTIRTEEADSPLSSDTSDTNKNATAERPDHRFRSPTLQNDYMFISSISNPSSNDFNAPTSPTRQIAMMLWASLCWYFHQTAPSPYITSAASKDIPEEGRPRGEWRVKIKRDGVLRGRNLIQKLERMGLIMSDDSKVGESLDINTAQGWSEMWTTRRAFWQLPGRLFLFTLSPAIHSFPGSPHNSRPSSPVRGTDHNHSPNKRESTELLPSGMMSPGVWSPSSTGPFSSGSHLPTYYPPAPLQYTSTSGIRHPLRPKPPRQGEVFYTRFVPTFGQYLAFRVASLSPRPVPYNGPISSLHPHKANHTNITLSSLPAHISASSIADPIPPTPTTPTRDNDDTIFMSDVQLLNKWMNKERVSKFWGCDGPQNIQDELLRKNMTSKHSFPVIALWDGKPFGYFEIYWAKEDILGKQLGGDRVGDFDRGFHVLVGEEDFRGTNRVKCWSTSLAHWAFEQDYRTNSVVLEPRVDNYRFISTLNEAGFVKEGEVTFPHKQSALVRLKRENFEAPGI